MGLGLEGVEGILDELTPEGTEVPSDAQGYARAGAVLAAALVTPETWGRTEREEVAALQRNFVVPMPPIGAPAPRTGSQHRQLADSPRD